MGYEVRPRRTKGVLDANPGVGAPKGENECDI